MSAMTDREAVTLMGDGGLAPAIEAVAELLVSLGYLDSARELLGRYDRESETGGEGCCCGC